MDRKRFPYAVDKHDNVWKYIASRGYYVKVTPWASGEDRRRLTSEIDRLLDAGRLTPMPDKPRTHEIVNRRWDCHGEEWDFDGEHFVVSEQNGQDDILQAPKHQLTFTVELFGGRTETLNHQLRVGFHHGRLIWVHVGCRYPQCVTYPFEAIDKAPDMSLVTVSMHITNARHIKPVFNATKGEYL